MIRTCCHLVFRLNRAYDLMPEIPRFLLFLAVIVAVALIPRPGNDLGFVLLLIFRVPYALGLLPSAAAPSRRRPPSPPR